MRRIGVLVLVAMSATACHRGARTPGASFVGASLLEPLSEAQAAHDELLRADLGRADSVSRLGMPDGLAANLTDDVVYLRGELPILRGRAAVRAIAATESIAAPFAVRWQPVRAEASRDGKSGYSYGYTIVSSAGANGSPSIRVDRYIAFWRHLPVGWRIAAYAETYGTPPPPLTMPETASSAVLANVPMDSASGALEAIRAADAEFSADAAKYGTGVAFGRYAAADAQMFSGPGEFITGPHAISESFGPPTEKNTLVWHPVHGEVAASGDLGFTVGNAVFTGVREDGARIERFSKYLTVWKKQRDGSWRYVVDGGSSRPR